jgi:hypothetical protein
LWKAHFCSLQTVWKPDYQNRLGAFRPRLYVVAFLVAWCDDASSSWYLEIWGIDGFFGFFPIV